MRKLYLILAGLCLAYYLPAQVIATENFETAMVAGTSQGDCSCINLPDQFTNGASDYYGRQNNATIDANGGSDYSGFDGSFYFAGEDHNSGISAGGTSTLSFVMENLTVPNPTQNRIYQVSLLAGGNNSLGAYDLTGSVDFISIEYSVDDQATFVPLICFSPTTVGINVLSEDSNCVLPGDGTNILGPAMASFSNTFTAINPTNNRIHIRVTANSDSNSEEWAIDNIQIIDNGIVLPVSLTEFRAQAQEKMVELNWTTATETNNAYFRIDRSLNGRDFTTISFEQGAGNSTEELHYKFLDEETPKASKIYYRLTQVDFDGQSTNSKIEIVEMPDSEPSFILAPNVASSVINVRFNNAPQPVDHMMIEVFDLEGKLIHQEQISSKETAWDIDVEHYFPGAYILNVSNSYWQQSSRFVKVRE